MIGRSSTCEIENRYEIYVDKLKDKVKAYISINS